MHYTVCYLTGIFYAVVRQISMLFIDNNISLFCILYLCTLRASLSGTFLQTLPDIVTPLKGTLYLRAAVHRRGQRPPKGSGTEKTVEAT